MRGIFLYCLLFLFLSLKSLSQNDAVIEVCPNPDTLPTFPAFMNVPAGIEAFYTFLAHNIVYPGEAKEKNITGTVYVSFVIDSNGNLVSSKILKGVHSSLDNEALNLINRMPKWKAGYYKGKKINARLNIPIKFSLTFPEKSYYKETSPANKKFTSANQYFENHKYKKAIELYNDAIELDNNYTDAYYNRAVCYFKLNDIENACKDWNKCVQLGDESVKELISKNCPNE